MRIKQADLIEHRIRFFAVLICLGFFMLFGRLWLLQIVRGSENLRRSVEYTTYDIMIPAPRGVFYDRHGKLLVANRISYDVVGLLENLKQHPEIVARLARMLGCPTETIETRLTTPQVAPYQFYPVAKDVPVGTAISIQESLNLPGITVQQVPYRRYPYGDFATHAFGYIREINNDELTRLTSSGYQLGEMIGKTGLERTLEPYLRGECGLFRIERDRSQRPGRTLASRDPVPGYDAWLTIDFDVQKAAEEALRARLLYLQRNTRYHRARAGAVIALDPRNGEILALASQPSFDPNIFTYTMPAATFAALNTNPDKPFNNRVLQGLYPPASTFKPFTVYAALHDGKAKLDEYFFCNGYDRVYGNEAKCWIASTGGGHGRLNLIGGLKNSCNVVMYELGRRLGVNNLARYTRLFHFGARTGIDLAPGDAAGTVPDIAYKKRLRPNDPWRELETLHFAIGQGYLEVTPIQLALAYAGIATGGHFYQPHLLKSIRTINGHLVRNFDTRHDLGHFQMDEATKKLIVEGLNEVVSGGTAASAFAGFPLDRYPIAGKTGTGQKRGYDDFSLFACFAPVQNPQIVVVVVIEQGGSGSAGAAPVARKILEAFFHIQYTPSDRNSQPATTPPGEPGQDPSASTPQTPQADISITPNNTSESAQTQGEPSSG